MLVIPVVKLIADSLGVIIKLIFILFFEKFLLLVGWVACWFPPCLKVINLKWSFNSVNKIAKLGYHTVFHSCEDFFINIMGVLSINSIFIFILFFVGYLLLLTLHKWLIYGGLLSRNPLHCHGHLLQEAVISQW